MRKTMDGTVVIDSPTQWWRLEVKLLEAVFGWEWVTNEEEPYLVEVPPLRIEGLAGVFYPKVAEKFPNLYPCNDIPAFCTDWGAVGLLIERMESKGWYFASYSTGDDRVTTAIWTKSFRARVSVKEENTVKGVESSSTQKTFPLAVSLATAEAMGIQYKIALA